MTNWRLSGSSMTAALSCFLSLFAVAAIAQAQSGPAERRYQLSDRGYLILTVPSGWREQVRTPDAKLPPTITFSSASGQPFNVLVTPIWSMKKDAPAPTLDELRRGVLGAADGAKGQAVEKSIDVVELKGPAGSGYFFKATDKAPKPGEFKYLAQGMIALGNTRVTFTILTNDGQSAIVNSALDMLRNSRLQSP